MPDLPIDPSTNNSLPFFNSFRDRELEFVSNRFESLNFELKGKNGLENFSEMSIHGDINFHPVIIHPRSNCGAKLRGEVEWKHSSPIHF